MIDSHGLGSIYAPSQQAPLRASIHFRISTGLFSDSLSLFWLHQSVHRFPPRVNPAQGGNTLLWGEYYSNPIESDVWSLSCVRPRLYIVDLSVFGRTDAIQIRTSTLSCCPLGYYRSLQRKRGASTHIESCTPKLKTRKRATKTIIWSGVSNLKEIRSR